jgi:azurin
MGQAALKQAPKNDKIIAGTKMLELGQSETINFTAPAKPGNYEFLCTFPGHWQVMNGIMKVSQ